ncbi:MAG: bifunctional diaminohydroxyphosphoribosylaminopyrimidine deaminase/5-amino-6-(5-phosphoribosylamino)uracil reductase RibD [Candidatus Zixiibacteriota bacterium]|nr:MAG: bifunctional diaminohydroxyphosphoribosylaminopyrimidine deaminase/5-amino-6-(5-phosphoribosylamino)uracil reductase RibD [candidate division Zixibacteria bacterium]
MAEKADEKYIRLALELAEKGRGKTSPNPLVGAVIVKSGRIVGQGYHRKAGTPHAEINALSDARENARGASLYVNLEPCCHYGRTQPCTGEIIKAGVRKVIFSLRDPNPPVNGKGAAQLRKAGIRVRSGVLRKEAEQLNEVYLKFITTGRPFVILKTAQTFDGRIATGSGDSKWVTGSKARKLVHRLRAECDAVAVGAGTVRADNPSLTVRLMNGRNPYRLIVSTGLKFPRTISLFNDNDDAKTIVATVENSARKLNVKNLIVWEIKKGKGGLSLDDFLDKAGQFGISSLLVEGGATLATSFIKSGLVDKHYIFLAPKVLGAGIEAVGNLNIRKMSDAIGYKSMAYIPGYEPDFLFIGYPEGK